jgi:hypothetical protein
LIVTQKPYHLLSLQSQYFLFFLPNSCHQFCESLQQKNKNTTM